MVAHVLHAFAALSLVAATQADRRALQEPSRLPADSTRHALGELARRAEAQGASGVVLVAAGNTVLLHRAIGWRDPAGRVPNHTTTLFYVASLLKQFVAAAVLKLEDQGQLHTTDSLATYFPDAPADKRRITIDQLLAHTSGLARYGWDDARRDWAVQDRDDALRAILATPLSHAPAARFDYQNVNYLLLTAIVERVTHLPFDAYAERELFAPAGMRDTYIGSRVTDALRRRVAWSIGDESESFTIMDRTPGWLTHGRGVVMTASDLYRWMCALTGGAVLSPAARARLFTIRAPLGPGYGYAAGWFVRTDSAGALRVAFHGGDFGSYHSEVRFYPSSGRILLALMNTGFRGNSITEPLLNAALDVSRGLPEALPPVARSGPSSAMALAGQYRAPNGDVLIVAQRGSSVVVTPIGQGALDWLTHDDTAGWRDRLAAGERSLSLVDALSHGRLEDISRTPTISAGLRHGLAAEWAGLTRTGGRLKSMQLLGVVPDGSGAGPLAIVRLKFQRDSLLYAVGWAGDTLRYTQPGSPDLVAPLLFAAASTNEWISYDWSTGRTHRLTTEVDGADQVTRLTLDTRVGPLVFIRRRR